LSKTDDPAIVFAACWLTVEKECPVKFRMIVDNSFVLWLDHQRIWKGYHEEGWKFREDATPVTLTAGPHLLLLKIATTGGSDFGFRFRIREPGGERVGGIRVSTQAPVASKVLFSENFNQGRGAFVGGEVVPGGVDGTSALAIPKQGALIEGKLPQRSG